MESFLEEFCNDQDERLAVMQKLMDIIRDPDRQFNENIQEVIDLIQSAGFVLEAGDSLEGANRLLSLYMEMHNSTPLPINYGHSAYELQRSSPNR